MSHGVRKRQELWVSHRMNFWGRPTGSGAVAWNYRGTTWRVTRPDDDSPPESHTVGCRVCHELLTYSVHSVASTLRRRRHRRLAAWSGLALLLAGVAGLWFVESSGSAAFVTAVVLAICVGAVVGWCSMLAAGDVGVTGHGAAWPGATAHAVSMEEE